MNIPASALLLLATLASMECTLSDASAQQERHDAAAGSFDPLSLQKDTTAREPFLDPLALFSEQVYLVRPLEPGEEVGTSAAFVGGEEAMVSHIRTKVLEHIAPGIGWLKHPTVHFTINEQGVTEQVELARTCGNDALDAALVNIFTEMPAWVPATDAQGSPMPQPFEFTVGPGGC